MPQILYTRTFGYESNGVLSVTYKSYYVGQISEQKLG